MASRQLTPTPTTEALSTSDKLPSWAISERLEEIAFRSLTDSLACGLTDEDEVLLSDGGSPISTCKANYVMYLEHKKEQRQNIYSNTSYIQIHIISKSHCHLQRKLCKFQKWLIHKSPPNCLGGTVHVRYLLLHVSYLLLHVHQYTCICRERTSTVLQLAILLINRFTGLSFLPQS